MLNSKWTRRKVLKAAGLAAAGTATGVVRLPSVEAAAAPVRGGQLKVATIGDPPTLDVMATTADITTDDVLSIYETLFAIDSTGNPQPILATDAKWSDGNLTLTLPLRTNVLFHNGQPMTANDVVASLQRWLRLGQLGQESAPAVKDIVPVDGHTVAIHLKEPLGLLPLYLGAPGNAMAGIMPKSIIDKYGDKPVQEYIGTGPFRLQEWKPDAHLHLTRWDKYVPVSRPASDYAGRRIAYVDDVMIYPVPDNNTRLAGIRTGQYDIAYNLPADAYEELKANPNLQTPLFKPDGWAVVNFNKKARVFTNIKLRQAVLKALSCQPMMQAGFGPTDFWSVASPTLGYFAYEDDKTGADVFNHPDAARAKALMAEAGYSGAPLVWLTTKNYAWMYNLALVGKSQLEAVGFKVDLQVMDWATLVQRRSQPEAWDIFQTGMTGPRAVPTSLVSVVSSGWPGWWSNPSMLEALKKFHVVVSLAERKAAWSEIQRLFYEDVPAVKAGDFYGYHAMQKRVHGYTNADFPPFWNIWLG
jgi:peptide/nickel transport system substrate-binding protein